VTSSVAAFANELSALNVHLDGTPDDVLDALDRLERALRETLARR